jgi:hypothetical protein
MVVVVGKAGDGSACCYGMYSISCCISVLFVLDSPGGLWGGRNNGIWLVDWLVGEMHWGVR